MTTGTTWSSVTWQRVRMVQAQLLDIVCWAVDAGADPDMIEMLVRPYREILEELFKRDFPLAGLADETDL